MSSGRPSRQPWRTLPPQLALLSVLVSMPLLAQPPTSPGAPLERLQERRVFFGHQSVGGNILDGLQTETRGALRLVEGEAEALGSPGLVHARIGRNEDPSSKLEHFARLVHGGVGGKADVAFFKFCYIDFGADTDVKALFERYRRTLAELRDAHPRTTFAHVTVPLVAVQRGWKGRLKNWLGKGAWGERENVRRHEFNELLRATYQGQEPLFDLAKLESTTPEGTAEQFERDGRSYPSLYPAYSDDAQHLNAEASRRVARALVEFLAAVPPKERAP